MTVEEALETLGISGIEVLFGALAIFTGKVISVCCWKNWKQIQGICR